MRPRPLVIRLSVFVLLGVSKRILCRTFEEFSVDLFSTSCREAWVRENRPSDRRLHSAWGRKQISTCTFHIFLTNFVKMCLVQTILTYGREWKISIFSVLSFRFGYNSVQKIQIAIYWVVRDFFEIRSSVPYPRIKKYLHIYSKQTNAHANEKYRLILICDKTYLSVCLFWFTKKCQGAVKLLFYLREFW
jgi:hypothetical protein